MFSVSQQPSIDKCNDRVQNARCKPILGQQDANLLVETILHHHDAQNFMLVVERECYVIWNCIDVHHPFARKTQLWMWAQLRWIKLNVFERFYGRSACSTLTLHSPHTPQRNARGQTNPPPSCSCTRRSIIVWLSLVREWCPPRDDQYARNCAEMTESSQSSHGFFSLSESSFHLSRIIFPTLPSQTLVETPDQIIEMAAYQT
jgi:hypothetical protein